jgi:hypothetical protein
MATLNVTLSCRQCSWRSRCYSTWYFKR